MRAQRPNERRSVYLMRVASQFIMENARDGIIKYDEADCDGHCLAEELQHMAEDMDVKQSPEKELDKASSPS